MGKKILIIGNGFDLDLGLKSRYRDFMESPVWKGVKGRDYILTCNLIRFLEEKNEIETWFDAETELLNYALKIKEGTYPSSSESDKDGHQFFLSMLKRYLLSEQENFQLNSNSVAVSLMKSISENGFFDEIYTFNYTDINKVLGKAGVYAPMKITYMHGSLQENDSIILGIETEKPIHKDYQFLFKTNSRFYKFNSLFESMEKADEIIFFGHSINGMDFPYFKDFFMKQARHSDSTKRKYITIFTYDENSDQQIRNNFREANVNLRDLMQRNNLTFIETKMLNNGDRFELSKWNELLEHLKIDSRETERNNLMMIENMFR